MEQRYL